MPCEGRGCVPGSVLDTAPRTIDDCVALATHACPYGRVTAAVVKLAVQTVLSHTPIQPVVHSTRNRALPSCALVVGTKPLAKIVLQPDASSEAAEAAGAGSPGPLAHEHMPPGYRE